MMPIAHPEVLAADYLPPVALGRSIDSERIWEQVRSAGGATGRARAFSIVGPPGSGTSTIARLTARRIVDECRRTTPGVPPLQVTVRVRWCRGSQGVAAGLLQHLDDGFRPSGFRVNEILAGFLRRLARGRRGAVVVLDDIGPSAPDLAPIFRALASPERFLPEGVDTAPPLWLLLAGVPEATAAWTQAARAGLVIQPPVRLRPYEPPVVRSIVRDRVARALGRPAPEPLEGRLVRRIAEGRCNAARALELVRRELIGHQALVPGSVFRPGGAPPQLAIEPRLVAAIAAAVQGDSVSLGEIRNRESHLAHVEGVRPMAATTLWRRLLRLEAEGLVRRDVRPGGAGGTRSVLSILRPLSEWPVPWAPTGTHPVGGAFGASRPLWPEPGQRAEPVTGPQAPPRPGSPAPG